MGIKYIKQWATSAGGSDISLYHSGDLLTHPAKPHMILIGGTHGDEPAGVELAKNTLNHLKSLDNESLPWRWTLIPCLNPDGFSSNDRTNANGVDLNRNYPSKNWSAHSKGPRYFPGTSPGSEPEISALVKWVEKHPPKLLIHFHSWEPCVVCTGDPALPLAQLFADSSGYALQNHIGYPTSGSLSQYGWHDNNIPVICTEEDDNQDVSSTWQRFGPAIEQLMITPCPY